MNIVKRLVWICPIVCLLYSCKNEAVDFNNSLVNIQKNVLKEVQDFGTKMKENTDSFPTDNVKPQADKIVLFISSQIKKAQELSTPKDGESLRTAILNQLQFEKDIVSKIGRLSEPTISPDEKTAIETDFLNSQHKADELEDSVRVAQETFAKKHKFKLEEK